MSVDAVLIAGPTAAGKSAAALTLAECINGVIAIGVRHDDEMILRSAQRLNPFAVCSATPIDGLRNRRRTDEAYSSDAGMRQNRFDRFAPRGG